MFSQARVKNFVPQGGVCQIPPGQTMQTPPGQPPPGQTATAADGTHPTGMYSCYYCKRKVSYFY